MKIIILSRSRWIYSTRRLIQAAQELGHKVRVMDPLQCTLVLDRKKPRIYYRGKRLVKADVVIPRVGASITQYGLAVVTTCEMMGLPVVNSAHAIAMSRDKFFSLQLLAARNLRIPRTLFGRDPAEVDEKLHILGESMPVILKLVEGTHGVGVMLAESREAVRQILASFWELGKSIIIQQFISEARGKDIRVFVVGGQVVAAMRRNAAAGEFRANIHRGGVGENVQLSEPYIHASLRAAATLGLGMAGVDLLESERGPLVMEVNSSPGLRGIETATGVDVAVAVIRHAVNYAMQAKEEVP